MTDFDNYDGIEDEDTDGMAELRAHIFLGGLRRLLYCWTYGQDDRDARTDIAEAVALIHLEDEDTRKSIADEIRRHIEEVRQ